jgi:hypothetical protein
MERWRDGERWRERDGEREREESAKVRGVKLRSES